MKIRNFESIFARSIAIIFACFFGIGLMAFSIYSVAVYHFGLAACLLFFLGFLQLFLMRFLRVFALRLAGVFYFFAAIFVLPVPGDDGFWFHQEIGVIFAVIIMLFSLVLSWVCLGVASNWKRFNM
ncbi:hypothetical protein [Chitiniphilus shinanonensis]|uniref:hypothetical protein n=1 Tax=Chitiniphilus shinanonensis TaxID=553088 RepID=UPI00334203E5